MNCLFSGTYEHQIDAKRRIRIPAKMKNNLGEGYSLTIGPDDCIWIMPAETMQTVYGNIMQIDMGDEQARASKRKFMRLNCQPEEDKQGRIVLPAHFIQKAGIEKDLLFIGQGNYIELWSKEKYEAYTEDFEDIDIGRYIKF